MPQYHEGYYPFCDFPEAGPGPDWINYLENNLQLDSLAAEAIPVGMYQARISFEIEIDGRLRNVNVVKDPGYGLGERARKIIQAYKGKWQTPSPSDPKIISRRIQPITYVIEKE